MPTGSILAFISTFIITIGLMTAMSVLNGCNDSSSQLGGQSNPSPQEVSAQAVKLEFDVKGMSCEGCVFAVRSAIAGLNGVESCEVSLAGESAVVAVQDEATERAIIEAVEKLNFTIARRNDTTASSESIPTDADDLADG